MLLNHPFARPSLVFAQLVSGARRLPALVLGLFVCGDLAWVPSGTAWGAESLSNANGHASEPRYIHEVWQTEQGLPNNGVQAILQAPNGYLWLGTSRGLARFDGVRFAVFTPKDDLGLTSEAVWRLCADRRGGFWIAGEDGGLSCWRNGRLQSFTSGDQPYPRRAFSLCCDREDRLWIATLAGEVDCIEGGQVRSLGHPGIGNIGPSSLAADLDGTVWLASRSSFGFFRSNTWVSVREGLQPPLEIAPRRAGGLWLVAGQRIYEVSPSGAMREVAALPWPADDTSVRQLLEDRRGTLWLGTSRHGLMRLHEGRLLPVATSHQSILSLGEDREGNLWVGTQGGGLNRVRESAFEIFDTKAGLPNDILHSLAEDRTGRMWFVPQSGGLSVLSNGVCTTLPASNFFGAPLLTVAPAADGGVWIGTIYDGLLHWKDGQVRHWTVADGLAGPRVDALLEDRQGRLWIGFHGEGLDCLSGSNLVHYTTAQGLPGKQVRVLVEDALGRIWIGTGEGRVARFSDGRFEAEMALPGSGAVSAIVPLDDGTLWVGTTAGGLVRVRPGAALRVTTWHGLPDDFIGDLEADDAGNLWCGSSRGLFRVALRELNAVADGRAPRVTVRAFGRSDGLADFTFPGTANPSSWRSRDGRLWFASAKGAVAVDLSRLAINQEPPPVVLEEVRCGGRAVDPAGVAEMPAGSRDWDFRFTALSLTAPERVRFRHFLAGYDTDWVEDGTERRAQYRDLPPGDYRFQVTACNHDGIWNEQGVSFAFRTAPFLWQTRWFPVAAVTLALGLIALSLRWVALRRLHRRVELLKQQHAVEQERVRIAQDLHDELGAALTRIGLLTDLARKPGTKPEAVAADLNAISTTARDSVQALDAIVWAVRPGNDSLDSFADYVGRFAEELLRPAGLRCRFDLPMELSDRRLGTEARHSLFLVVKEALNNVVRHAQASEVWLRLAGDARRLVISIEDNGRGLSPAPAGSGHDGLANIRERVERLGGRLEVESPPGGGTQLKLEVPWSSSST